MSITFISIFFESCCIFQVPVTASDTKGIDDVNYIFINIFTGNKVRFYANYVDSCRVTFE